MWTQNRRALIIETPTHRTPNLQKQPFQKGQEPNLPPSSSMFRNEAMGTCPCKCRFCPAKQRGVKSFMDHTREQESSTTPKRSHSFVGPIASSKQTLNTERICSCVGKHILQVVAVWVEEQEEEGRRRVGKAVQPNIPEPKCGIPAVWAQLVCTGTK